MLGVCESTSEGGEEGSSQMGTHRFASRINFDCLLDQRKALLHVTSLHKHQALSSKHRVQKRRERRFGNVETIETTNSGINTLCTYGLAFFSSSSMALSKHLSALSFSPTAEKIC